MSLQNVFQLSRGLYKEPVTPKEFSYQELLYKPLFSDNNNSEQAFSEAESDDYDSPSQYDDQFYDKGSLCSPPPPILNSSVST